METASPLRIGALVSVATLGFAAVVGLVAVVDADDVQSAVGVGVMVGVTTFATGGTIACGLSCLVRHRLEWVSVAALALAGLGLDLLVLAVWQGIDSEAYGKATAIAFVWTLFALLGLGLTIAVGELGQAARAAYLAAIVSTVAAAAIATWLIVTAAREACSTTRSHSSVTTACCEPSARPSCCSRRSGSPRLRSAGSTALDVEAQVE